MSSKRKYDIDDRPDFVSEPRLIAPDEWRQQRWGWMESVRRDASLSFGARLLADVLALEFVNLETNRCDPSHRQLAELLGTSTDTVKRSIKALIDADWIVALPGVGRGNSTRYGFLTRAKIVQLKGGKSAPRKGGDPASFYDTQKGADLHGKGGKSASAHNIDKPCLNHGGREPRKSVNPIVVSEAIQAVSNWRDGRASAFADLKPWVIDHIIAAKLLTDAELATAGLC